MFCPACGTPTTPGISFCNRCGRSLKERSGETSVRMGAIIAFLIAIAVIGIAGLGIMFGGALSLKTEAQLSEEVVGMFMFFTFFVVSLTEFLLVRQLSKLVGTGPAKSASLPIPAVMPNELRSAPARNLPEHVPSVTENTTRTLEYSRDEVPR